LKSISELQRNYLKDVSLYEGLKQGTLLNDKDTYRDLLNKINQSSYTNPFGKPFINPAKAILGQPISVPELQDYLDLADIDLQVSHKYVDYLSKELKSQEESVLSELKLLENRTGSLALAAKTIEEMEQNSASWLYSESFSLLDNIDFSKTTAWVNSEVGSVEIPKSTSLLTPVELITSIVGVDNKSGLFFNGTRPDNILDPIKNSPWIIRFTEESQEVSCDLYWQKNYSVRGVTIEPAAGPVHVKILTREDDKLLEIANKLLYSKSTIAFSTPAKQNITIIIKPVSQSFPTILGINYIWFEAETSTNEAVLYTNKLIPTIQFNEVLIDSDSQLPVGAEISYEFSLDGSSWVETQPGAWYATSQPNVNVKDISLTDLNEYGFLYRTNGLLSASKNESEGYLQLGIDQFEVSSIRKVFSAEGKLAFEPSMDLFTGQENRVWESPVLTLSPAIPSSYDVQIQLVKAGDSPHVDLTRGNKLIGSQAIARAYTAFSLMPIYGQPTQYSMATNRVYKLSCKFFSDSDNHFPNALYWFLQGFREDGTSSFRQNRLSYGGFSLYINGIKVAADNQADTLYSGGTAESGANSGNGFSFAINKGWNTYDLLVSVPEIPSISSDSDTLDERMLQLTIYPNIFDPQFKEDYGITKIIGSGELRPQSEKDLLWNLPKSLTYWAWDTLGGRSRALFTSNRVEPIDGFIGLDNEEFRHPRMRLIYTGFDGTNEQNTNLDGLYIRVKLKKAPSSMTHPYFSGLKVLVR